MGQIKLTIRCVVFIGILIPWVNNSVFSLAITDFDPKYLPVRWQLIENDHLNITQFLSGLPELTAVGAKRGFPFEDNRQLHLSCGSGVNGEQAIDEIKNIYQESGAPVAGNSYGRRRSTTRSWERSPAELPS